MPLELQRRELESLPKLAWLAAYDRAAGRVVVLHVPGVEGREDWVVEGVWDGDFALGAFHRSDHFFGSGVRLEGDRAYFVPSRALADRLLYCVQGRSVLVSNSLALLLAHTGRSEERRVGKECR